MAVTDDETESRTKALAGQEFLYFLGSAELKKQCGDPINHYIMVLFY